jgi:fatty-acyl-CoA synthase
LILTRHPDVAAVAVYGVPDPQVGDLVMAAIELRPGAAFDASQLAEFLAAQPDLGTKMTPRFVRIVDAIPMTSTMKPVRRDLRRAAWITDDSVWWRRSAKARDFVLLTATDVDELREAFVRHGRASFLPG